MSGSSSGEEALGCLASLHRTLGVAEAVWVRADALLQDYAVERAALSTRRRQLLADWEHFKAQQRSQQHQQDHQVMKNGTVQSNAVTSSAGKYQDSNSLLFVFWFRTLYSFGTVTSLTW